MRRKLGVILMTVATLLAGTSQAARQYENLKGALADWTARGSQPGLLFFAGEGEESAKYSTRQMSRNGGDDNSTCVSSAVKPPTETTETTETHRLAAASPSRVTSHTSRAPELAANHGLGEQAAAAARRQEAAQLRREIAQAALSLDVVEAGREIEAAVARIPARERVQMRRAFDGFDWREVNGKLQVKFALPLPPAPVPGKKTSAVVKVRWPETSRDDARQGTKRRERRMIRRLSAVPQQNDDVQLLASPDPGAINDPSEASGDAALDCQDNRRR